MVLIALVFQANEGLYLWMLRLSKLAEINIGITSSMTSLTPLYIAVMERVWFKTSLKLPHLIAFLILIICSLCISLAKTLEIKIYGKDVI